MSAGGGLRELGHELADVGLGAADAVRLEEERVQPDRPPAHRIGARSIPGRERQGQEADRDDREPAMADERRGEADPDDARPGCGVATVPGLAELHGRSRDDGREEERHVDAQERGEHEHAEPGQGEPRVRDPPRPERPDQREHEEDGDEGLGALVEVSKRRHAGRVELVEDGHAHVEDGRQPRGERVPVAGPVGSRERDVERPGVAVGVQVPGDPGDRRGEHDGEPADDRSARGPARLSAGRQRATAAIAAGTATLLTQVAAAATATVQALQRLARQSRSTSHIPAHQSASSSDSGSNVANRRRARSSCRAPAPPRPRRAGSPARPRAPRPTGRRPPRACRGC